LRATKTARPLLSRWSRWEVAVRGEGRQIASRRAAIRWEWWGTCIPILKSVSYIYTSERLTIGKASWSTVGRERRRTWWAHQSWRRESSRTRRKRRSCLENGSCQRRKKNVEVPLTRAKSWRGSPESHGRTAEPWRWATQVLRAESESSWRRTTRGFVRRGDLVDYALGFIMSES
jgi:hypothetical protein